MPEDMYDKIGVKIRHRKISIINRSLLIAASEGDKDLIYTCIKEGADINFVDKDGNTSLHYAVISRNVEVVKILIEKVEDINAENNECKTPLDIAVELKQNDILEVLSEKNLEKAFEILKNEEYQQSDDTVNKLTFMEATFHNNYYKIPLSKEDIQNILDFTYLRRNSEKIFKAIEAREDFLKEIEVFTEDKKTTTLLLKLENYWLTLVFYYTKEDDIDQFKAYYFDSYEKDLPTFIINILTNKRINDIKKLVSGFQLIPPSNLYDSGIFALKYAELCNSNFFLDENKAKEELQNIELNTKKEREFYANILMEKNRVEEKIKVCLKTLQNLTENESYIEKLNHKNANVFINFLEAFALQDTFPNMSKIWTNDELEENKKTLTDLKKSYFTTFYFETKNKKELQSDLTLIDSARNICLHGKNIIQPENIVCFMKDDSNVSKFFKDLKDYTEYIKNKIDSKLIKNDENFKNFHGEICCHSFLAFGKDIKNKKKGDLLDIRNFLLEIYKPENEIDQNKTIFDLTVNIVPIIDEIKVESLSVERNNLVHNYQEKSILNNEKKFKEIKELHALRSDLFKYFYSVEVYRLMSEMLLDKNTESLFDEFQKVLEDFQKNVVKAENISLTSSEQSKSFEYIFQGSLFPESDENINNLVDKYLKYAFIVEIKAGAQVPIDDEVEAEIEHKKLTDDKKREIFEDFMKLEKLTHKQFKNERKRRNKLKEKLKEYGREVSYFDRVVGYYLDDSNELPAEIIKKRQKIISIISILRKIKKNFSLSNTAIINLYEKCLELKQKGIANLTQFEPILDKELNKTKLTNQKSSILKELYDFSAMETIDIMIESVKITELNTFDIIRNILSVFCSSYDTYKVKFDNVEEAFNDDIFLDYLVSLNIEKKNDCKVLKDKYFVFTMIKKLLNMEYASPYIAKLLIESNNDSIIEEKDFIHLLRNLLKNKAYVKHLTKLLNVKSEKFDVYGEFCSQILDNNCYIENIHVILQEYYHVNAIFNKLDEKIKNIKSNHLMEDEASKVEEFCHKLLDKDFNIKNMHIVLQDNVEVKDILSKLSAKIENVKTEQSFHINVKQVREFLEKNFNDINVQNEFKNCITEILFELNVTIHNRVVDNHKEKSVKKIEEIIQQIQKELNIITYDLHCDNCYDDVVKILEASIEASKRLVQNDDLKKILLDAKFLKAKSAIQLARMEKSKCVKEKKIMEALKILMTIENKQDRNPFFLLISAEIAYAQCLLKEHSKSYETYNRLFKKIAVNISNNDFCKLENSKEYQKMLNVSHEAKKYLSITNLQTCMAFNKNCRGWELSKKNAKQSEAFSNHKAALKILEELYSYRIKSLNNASFTQNNDVVLRIASKILYTKHSIAKLLVKKKEFKNALQHYHDALVKCIQWNKSLKTKYADFNLSLKKNEKTMAQILRDIACANAEFNKILIKTLNDISWNKDLLTQQKNLQTLMRKDRKLKNIETMCEKAQEFNKKLLKLPSYSETEKKQIDSLKEDEESRICKIKQEIKIMTGLMKKKIELNKLEAIRKNLIL